jgi:hypothetical protein
MWRLCEIPLSPQYGSVIRLSRQLLAGAAAGPIDFGFVDYGFFSAAVGG